MKTHLYISVHVRLFESIFTPFQVQTNKNYFRNFINNDKHLNNAIHARIDYIHKSLHESKSMISQKTYLLFRSPTFMQKLK